MEVSPGRVAAGWLVFLPLPPLHTPIDNPIVVLELTLLTLSLPQVEG